MRLHYLSKATTPHLPLHTMTNTFLNASATSSLAKLLLSSQELYTCSDSELQSQLHQLAVAQPERLVPLLRLLLHNSQYLWQYLSAAEALVATPSRPVAAASPLSSRERDILALLARGCTLPQIGEKLFISPATVNNHCARMREKLELKGRNALIGYAIEVLKQHH